VADSSLWRGLVGMTLVAGCSTGRQAETSHAQQRTAASRAGSTTPDFDASVTRVRTLLEQLVAADTENPPGNEARAAALGAARLQAAGIPYQRFEFAPGRQNLIARIKGTGLQGLCCCSPTPTSFRPPANPGRVRRTD